MLAVLTCSKHFVTHKGQPFIPDTIVGAREHLSGTHNVVVHGEIGTHIMAEKLGQTGLRDLYLINTKSMLASCYTRCITRQAVTGVGPYAVFVLRI